ncbi:MAG: NAD(P)-binding protein [Candidatus Micrarchaeota archaeon]
MAEAKNSRGHYIICGHGRVGETICDILREKKAPFVIVEKDADIARKLEKEGMTVVEGDATRAKVLLSAGIERAKGLVSLLSLDSANVFVVLTAKELRPEMPVASRAFSEEVVGKMHKAGASLIVLPEIIGGVELAEKALEAVGAKVKK